MEADLRELRPERHGRGCTLPGVRPAARPDQRGLGQTNSLLVQFGGSHFDFFINGIKVGQADDSTISAGSTGLASSTGMQAVFNNMTIATYP